MGFLSIDSRGLWLVVTVVVLPYMHWRKCLQAYVMANISFSICKYRFSAPLRDRDPKATVLFVDN